MANDIKQEKGIGSKLDIDLRKSKRYEYFTFINGTKQGEWNRNLNKSNLARLRKSMSKDGYSFDRPIVVYWDNKLGKYVIVDGQHRFTIAEELDFEFSYVVSCDKENALKRAMLLNGSVTPWKTEDFVKAFASQGNVHCKTLIDVATNYGVSTSLVATLCAGVTDSCSGGLKDKLISGVYTIKALGFAIRILDILKRLGDDYDFGGKNKSRAIVAAFSKLCLIPEFEESRFFKKLDIGVKFDPCVSCDEYIRAIDVVYNYKTQIGNRIDLTHKIKELMNKRGGNLSR